MAQTLPNSKNDLIISRVQRELEANIKVLPFLTDLSAFASKGVKQIEVPRLSSFTAANRTFGAAFSESTLTDATDALALDQNSGVMWIEDKADEIQSSIEFRMEASKKAAAAVGRFVSDAIYTGIDAAAGSSLNGAVPADVTKANMLDLREYVLCNEGRVEDMVYLVGCDQESVLLNIADFIRADSYGSQPTALQSGVIGRLYGVPVIIDNGIKSQQVYCIDKAGYAYASQRSMNMQAEDDIQYGTNAQKVVVDHSWGHAPMQVGEKAAGAGNSPLIAALRD